MDLNETLDDRVNDAVGDHVSDPIDDRGRLVRGLLAVGLGIVAIASLRKGHRLRGVLAGAGAVAVGYRAASAGTETDPVDAVTADEDDAFRCAACGERITTGQARGPNADDEIVHIDCKASSD